MDRSSPGIDETHTVIETEMVDLQEFSLDELRTAAAQPLEPYLDRVMRSIARPRMNLGNSGPPGRDD